MKEIQLKNKTVNMRELTMRDMVATDAIDGQMAKDVHLIASTCELPKDEVLDMPLTEYRLLQKNLQAFLGNFPTA